MDYLKKKFNFDKICDYYFLFLETAEMNVREADCPDAENYEDLYNDCHFEIPYKLFMKKLKRYIGEVTLLTDEHEQEILDYFKDLIKVLPRNTSAKIEKIIRKPFEYKRMKKDKKKREGLTVKIIKEFFKEN